MAVSSGYARLVVRLKFRFSSYSGPQNSTISVRFYRRYSNCVPNCGSFGSSRQLKSIISTEARERNLISKLRVRQLVVTASCLNKNNNNLAGGVPNMDTAVNPEAEAAESSIPVNDEVVAVTGVGCGEGTSKAAYSKAPFLHSDGSIVVHAGERMGRGIVTDGITTPVVSTSAYWFKNSDELISFKEGRHTSFEYGRYGNPTTVVAEEKISALEGAESTVLMASGMPAITTMMFALVKNGGKIVTTKECYSRTFIEDVLVPKMNISDLSVIVIDTCDMDSLKSALDQNNVTLFFTESSTNPFFRCVDIELVSKLCRSRGTLPCVDGTFATPLNQKALALGADIILHFATKFIAGHNDSAAYLVIRGMKTMHLGVQQQNSTALKMAKVLEAHPKVTCVHYPGLPSHPEHKIGMQQMKGFGAGICFEIDGDLNTSKKFMDALKIPYIAPSFGGCNRTVWPAIMAYWTASPAEKAMNGMKGNLIRFSCKIEDFKDLKEDILQALEAI